jgi:hypothetical protein
MTRGAMKITAPLVIYTCDDHRKDEHDIFRRVLAARHEMT